MRSDIQFRARSFMRGLTSVVAFLLVVVFGLAFGVPAYGRYQARRDAANQIEINRLRIQQTEQLVDVERQKAQIKRVEAEGIAAAQHIINSTLTDRYLQHEAIQAQERMAGSPNHTQIYIPVGQNGIPLVKTVGDDTPNNAPAGH